MPNLYMRKLQKIKFFQDEIQTPVSLRKGYHVLLGDLYQLGECRLTLLHSPCHEPYEGLRPLGGKGTFALQE